MKKWYVISTVTSFAVAAICLSVSGKMIFKWSAEDHKEWANIVFAKPNWAYRLVVSNSVIAHASDASPVKIETKNLKKIRFMMPKGNLTLKAGAEGLLTALILEEGCELVVSTSDGSELTAKLAKKDDPKEGCAGDLDAQVPQQVDVRFSLGKGNASVEKMMGDIKFEVGAGDVVITDSKGDLRGEVGIGDISVVGKSKEIRMEMGVGKMKMKLSEKIAKGEWKLSAGKGDISIELPSGQIAEEKFDTGMGDKILSNQEKKKSEFEIKASSGFGDIKSIIK